MADKQDHYIVGVHITNRVKHVPSVQAVLTQFGCSIKTRLGLHETTDAFCSPNGLLLVELVGGEETWKGFTGALDAIEGVDVKSMVFTHD